MGVKLADALKKLIGYVRVSTDKQGKTRLGLESQLAALQAHAASVGGVLVRVYEEVESGRDDARPELAKALAHARRIKATVVFAKLDRLSRSARFLLGLVDAMEQTDATLIFADFPSIPEGPMGRFILTQMAAVAELEAGLISARTKAALRTFVEQGMVPKRLKEQYPAGVPDELVDLFAGKLGAARPGGKRLTWDESFRGCIRSAEVRRERAVAAYSDIFTFVREMKADGLSLRQIAGRLNEEGHTTRKGAPWNPVQVGRVLALAS
jgi:DNA invertase Pin-like site-specific DNA recombinase